MKNVILYKPKNVLRLANVVSKTIDSSDLSKYYVRKIKMFTKNYVPFVNIFRTVSTVIAWTILGRQFVDFIFA